MDRDYKIIQEILRNSFLFSELDEMEISNAANDFEIISLAPGESLYTENEPADYFYFAASGKVNESIGKGTGSA